MGQRRISIAWLALDLLLVGPSCKQPDPSYVRLDFKGTLDRSIQSIAVDVLLGSRTDTTSFAAEDGGSISLPVSAALEIGSGEGELAVSARALDEQQGILAKGVGSGQVTAGQTTSVEVWLFALVQDAGPDVAGPDAAASNDGAVASDEVASMGKDAATVEIAPSAASGGAGGSWGAGGSALGAGGVTVAPGTGGSSLPTTEPGEGGAGGAGAGGAGGAGGVAATTGGVAGSVIAPGGRGGVGTDTGGTSGIIAGAGGAGGTSDTTPPAGCKLSVLPETLDFGPVPVGTASQPKAVTATNLGNGTCSKLVIYVHDGQHFPVSQTPCSGQTLDPNHSCIALFTFNPDLVGPFITDGSITPAEAPPTQFFLSGQGQDPTPQLTMNPTSVDFKLRDVGSVASMEFTVTNGGGADTGTIGVLLNGWPAFSVVNNQCGSASLPKGGRCTFTLLFIPPTIGPGQVQIDAKSASGGKATSFASGTGRDYAPLNVLFAGTGKGTVNGTNLNCPSDSPCGISIERTDPAALPKVELAAQPDGSSQFVGWKGPCSGTDKCSFVMDGPKNVTAVFDAR